MRFLVVGDSMLDVYWTGHISRLNPEKHSSPLVHVRGTVELPGGASNVAKNLEALGMSVALVSGVGHIVKHRIMDEDGVICRFDMGDELLPIEASQLPDEKFDAVVVADYAKGSVNANVALEIKNKYGSPIFVDTKSHPAPWINAATCLFPNAAEFTEYSYDYKCASLVLVKQGPKGAQLFRKGVRAEQFKSCSGYISNVAGAGDTVVAAYAAAVCSNIEHGELAQIEASEFAMKAAAVAVSMPRTYAPTLGDIAKMFPEFTGTRVFSNMMEAMAR